MSGKETKTGALVAEEIAKALATTLDTFFQGLLVTHPHTFLKSMSMASASIVISTLEETALCIELKQKKSTGKKKYYDWKVHVVRPSSGRCKITKKR